VKSPFFTDFCVGGWNLNTQKRLHDSLDLKRPRHLLPASDAGNVASSGNVAAAGAAAIHPAWRWCIDGKTGKTLEL